MSIEDYEEHPEVLVWDDEEERQGMAESEEDFLNGPADFDD